MTSTYTHKHPRVAMETAPLEEHGFDLDTYIQQLEVYGPDFRALKARLLERLKDDHDPSDVGRWMEAVEPTVVGILTLLLHRYDMPATTRTVEIGYDAVQESLSRVEEMIES